MSDYKPRLKKEYKDKIQGQLKEELGLDNVMAVPKLDKIVINVGLGDAKDDSSLIEVFAKDLRLIVGQEPVVTKAKKAISNFKIREGQPIGLKVTLRGDRMWEFIDRLINVVFPRVRDFRGLSDRTFDGKGNYTTGISEHMVFPEVDPNKVTRPHGMQITICTSGENDKAGRKLLKLLGMPFLKK